jgi:hypothetical protein
VSESRHTLRQGRQPSTERILAAEQWATAFITGGNHTMGPAGCDLSQMANLEIAAMSTEAILRLSK